MEEAVQAKTRTQRLVEYLWVCQRKQFKYTVHDCFTFPAVWVDAELGTEYLRAGREIVRCNGLTKTIGALREPGAYAALVEEVTGRHRRTGPGWLPGDVAVFAGDAGETLGLLSSRMVHAPGDTGLVSTDAARVICHWGLECLRH